MSYLKIFSMMTAAFMIGTIIGIAYSSYITLAYSDEDYDLSDVIRLTVCLITGRLGK